MESTNTMPMINQVYRDVALKSLVENGLPESLIAGVDCSTLETMEESLDNVKKCFYASIRKHIEETYGAKAEKPELLLHRMEYDEKDYWDMFKAVDCSTENNKYIANLYCILSPEIRLGTDRKMGAETKRLLEKERLLEKISESGIAVGIEAGIKVGIDENRMKKFNDYIDLQGTIRGEVEKEGFICGFRTAYHLLEECRA